MQICRSLGILLLVVSLLWCHHLIVIKLGSGLRGICIICPSLRWLVHCSASIYYFSLPCFCSPIVPAFPFIFYVFLPASGRFRYSATGVVQINMFLSIWHIYLHWMGEKVYSPTGWGAMTRFSPPVPPLPPALAIPLEMDIFYTFSHSVTHLFQDSSNISSSQLSLRLTGFLCSPNSGQPRGHSSWLTRFKQSIVCRGVHPFGHLPKRCWQWINPDNWTKANSGAPEPGCNTGNGFAFGPQLSCTRSEDFEQSNVWTIGHPEFTTRFS